VRHPYLIPSLCIFAALAGPVLGKEAQLTDEVTVVDQMKERYHDYWLGFLKSSKGPKMTIIIGKMGSGKDNPSSTVYFMEKADWDQFVTLWKKARLVIPPKDHALDVGTYSNAATKTSVVLSVEPNGAIHLTIRNEDDTVTNTVTPLDFERINEDIDRLSVYWRE
jgi:hypothetical protein